MTEIEVGDLKSLQEAWAAQAREDLAIRVVDGIKMGGSGLPPIRNEHTLTLTFAAGTGLDSQAVIAGAYTDRNAIQYRGRALIIQGGWIAGYNLGGAAIRADWPELIEVNDTVLGHCGDVVYPARSEPIRTSADVVTSQCIAAFHPQTELRCNRVIFDGCSTGDVSYSHGIYATCRRVSVRGCQWSRCGSPLAVYGRDGVVVEDCVLDQPALCNRSRVEWVPPYFMILNACPTEVRRCRLTGEWGAYVIGHAPGPAVRFADNDLKGARFGRWSSFWGEPSWSRDDWLAAGQDTGTEMPV